MKIIDLKSQISLYFSITFTRRKMIQAILKGYNSKRDIAWYAKCTPRAVCDFFRDSKNPKDPLFYIIMVKEKFDEYSNMQEANEINLTKPMKKTLEWLSSYGYLDCVTRKKKSILRHAHNEQNTLQNKL